MGRKFRSNDRSVENNRKNVIIGKVKKHALSADKEDDNLNALDEKPKFISKGFLKNNLYSNKIKPKEKNQYYEFLKKKFLEN